MRWEHCVAIGAPEREEEYLCSAFIRGLHPLFSSLIEAYYNNLMGELNLRHDIHSIQPLSLPDHFPLDQQGQANYLDPTTSQERRRGCR